MLPLLFMLDHPRYARHVTYQHVFMSSLKKNNDIQYRSLEEQGFGASYSGNSFTNVHGDLVTEYANKEMKGSTGPFRNGNSTIEKHRRKYQSLSHTYIKIKTTVRERLNLKTPNTHKGTVESGKKYFFTSVKRVKYQIRNYGFDIIGNTQARNIPTGKVINTKLVTDLLNIKSLGNSQLQTFVKECLIESPELSNSKIHFYSPIKRNNLIKNLNSTKKRTKSTLATKEDCQAFGIAMSLACSAKEALCNPLNRGTSKRRLY